MHALLERIDLQPDTDSIDALTELVQKLRPPKPEQIDLATTNLRTLIQLLKGDLQHATALRRYMLRFLSTRRQTSLYTDVGLLSNDGFFTELFRRFSFRLLPPARDDAYLCDCLDRILFVNTDYIWISGVPAADWLTLFDILADADAGSSSDPMPGAGKAEDEAAAKGPLNQQKTMLQLMDAIQTLSYRISAIGLEPSLIRIHQEIEIFESPFLMQNVEVHLYLEGYVRYLAGGPVPTEDAKHLLVMLDQCDTVVAKIRKKALHQGTSIALTYLLVRLTQSIERLRKLLSVVDLEHDVPAPCALPSQGVEPPVALTPQRCAALELGLELVQAHNKKYAMRELFANSINLLARNITENASRTGEHYIAENRSEYGAMLRSSAGAGFIIGFMATIKILMSYLRAAPLVEAFLFSMNYSIGFMLIHVLHFTIATKQPAMTASRIASGLHSRDGRNIDLDSMVELIVKVLRTQFVAVLGNLITAFPMAYLIAWGYFYLQGQHLVTPDKAQHLLHDIDPLTSLALFHAAIAGVCLFLAGLISGYYDNQAAYTRISQRVVQLRWLQRLLGPERLARFAVYMENNLGGLMGNLYFGIFLGTLGTLGYMLGLPIDIRHVTFSATNLSIALVGLDHQVSWQLVVTSVIGILSIGAMNILVSFGLALFVALRSRQVRFTHGLLLLKSLVRRFWSGPQDFFIAPKDMQEAVVAEESVRKDNAPP